MGLSAGREGEEEKKGWEGREETEGGGDTYITHL